MLRARSEPYRLAKYYFADGRFQGQLFTCGRPGRSLGSKATSVLDSVVFQWVQGLPEAKPLHIVSLLGHKPQPSSKSEYSYYSFRGGRESLIERPGTLTFQEWLDLKFHRGDFLVIDYPTIDTETIDPTNLAEICSRVRELLRAGRAVLIVDSGGVGRSGKVCAELGARVASSV